MSLDTKAIRARADAATAGPWGSLVQRVPDGEPWIEVLAERRLVCEAATTMDQKLTPHDAANFEFIAAARTDVPALCDEVDRLRDWQGTALSMGWAPATSPEAAEWRNRIDAMQREYLAETERLRAALRSVVQAETLGDWQQARLDARAALEGGER